jgi:hypothetical protein
MYDPITKHLSDFPKVYCPYIRQRFKVDREDWKKNGKQLQLRDPEAYLVVNKINPGYEWVFDDPNTIAVEKLDGTNIKIFMEKGRLMAVQNRLNVIDPLQLVKGKSFIMEGLYNSAAKEMVMADGEYAGELIGPKLQGNPYKLTHHEWYPFEKALNDLTYRSFHEHEKNFENLSIWFKDHLHSRLFTKRASKLGLDEKVFSEGVIFFNRQRQAAGQTYMAKLRRNMFLWYYEGSVKVQDYLIEGRAEDKTEQDQLD